MDRENAAEWLWQDLYKQHRNWGAPLIVDIKQRQITEKRNVHLSHL
jgi:hypothetical protein